MKQLKSPIMAAALSIASLLPSNLSAFTASEQIVVDLFVAAYARTPAQGGLTYWAAELDSGRRTSKDVAYYMMNNAEAQAKYPSSLTTAEIVEAVFVNVIGRGTATDAGREYWAGRVDNEEGYTIADFINNVIYSARTNADKAILDNKSAVAEYFLSRIPVASQAGLQVSLAAVTAALSTVNSIKSNVDSLVSGLPTADAGADQTVNENDNVMFDSLGSSDDGTIVSYEWKEGNTVLSTASSFSKSDFSVGTHTVILTVTDNDGITNSDDVVITVADNITTGTEYPLSNYSWIVVYNNINPTIATGLQSAYTNYAGFNSVVSNTGADCADYGFTNLATTAGTAPVVKTYTTGTGLNTRWCAEADYSNVPYSGGTSNVVFNYNLY